MIEKNITFVLGAGASMDYGFPSGKGLYNRIIEILEKSTSPEYEILKNVIQEINLIREFHRKFTLVGNYSIDEFLRYNPDLRRIGKALICIALIPFESNRLLFDYKKDNSWYFYLFEKMKTIKENFGKNKISFVTFNYDRSLETFLYLSLINSYNISEIEAATLLKNFEFIHIHGKLGNPIYLNDEIIEYYNENPCSMFPENNITYDGDPRDGVLNNDTDKIYFRDYYPTVTRFNVMESIKYIKIIHDEENSQEIKRAKELIDISDVTCFLGFGFHDINLKRLDIESRKCPKFCGTLLGFSNLEKKFLYKRVKDKFYDPLFPQKPIYNFLKEDFSELHSSTFNL